LKLAVEYGGRSTGGSEAICAGSPAIDYAREHRRIARTPQLAYQKDVLRPFEETGFKVKEKLFLVGKN